MAEKTIVEAIEKLESISTELTQIKDFEKKLCDAEENLFSKLESLNEFESKISDMIDKFSAVAAKIDEFNESFGPVIAKMDSLLSRFSDQLNDAKQLETKFLLQRMDELMNRAESIAPKKSPNHVDSVKQNKDIVKRKR